MLEHVSRRRFLMQIAVLGGSVLLAPAASRADEALTWVPIGPASKFKPGSFTRITLPDSYQDEEIYVTEQADGSYLALLARCTHKGCLVDWQGGRKEFVCPCHSGRYDALGKNISGPPPSPLRTLRTSVAKNGIVSVEAP